MARLVPDDVVEDGLGGEHEAPVEAHRAGRGAAAPAGALVADGEAGMGLAEGVGRSVESRGDLVLGLGAVPALEGSCGVRGREVQLVLLAMGAGSALVVVEAQMGTEEGHCAGWGAEPLLRLARFCEPSVDPGP